MVLRTQAGFTLATPRMQLTVNEVHRISVKSVEIVVSAAGPLPPSLHPADHRLSYLDRSGRLRVHIEAAPWAPDSKIHLQRAMTEGVLQLVVGDYTEPGVSTKDGICANATLIDIDLLTGRCSAKASLVGLPPITYCRNSQIASISCPLLPRARATGTVDLEGAADTLRWGHPLDGRTLLGDTRIVAPRTTITIATDQPLTLLTEDPKRVGVSYEEISEEQMLNAQLSAFVASATRMPRAGSFLSLSGGLDSRTALVALLQGGQMVPCVSMSGSARSLDAQIAQQFCRLHGLQHEIVELDEDYIKQLPDLALRSAALTGGVACLSQTIDLYVYSRLSESSTIRISGHLGNQVGRGGVESIAAAHLSDQVFGECLNLALARRAEEPWFVPRMAAEGYASVLFDQEVHYWSIANYMLGSSKALQLSPYADAALVNMAKVAISRDPKFRNPTKTLIRRRDIRHRLFGPPLEKSFQRSFLVRCDPLGDDVPINWGWRPRGGLSVRWNPDALRTAADAVVSKLSRQLPALRPPLMRLSRAMGRPSSLVAWPDMLRGPLRSLAYDTLLSNQVVESGLFNAKQLRAALDDHYRGEADHYSTIYRCLEIALGISTRA